MKHLISLLGLCGALFACEGGDGSGGSGGSSNLATGASRATSVSATVSSSATTGGVGGGAPELADACAKTSRYTTSDGIEVTRCDELHPERPYVRTPAEKIEGEIHTLVGAYEINLGVVLPNGEILTLVDDLGKIYPFQGPDAPWAARLNWPSSRILVYLYEWVGRRTTVMVNGTEKPALQFVDARALVYFPPEVIDGAALGAWEGTVAGLLPVPMGIIKYGLDHGAKIRVEYTSLQQNPKGLAMWNPGDASYPEGGRFDVIGSIVNMTTSVRGADGTCIPALSSNPAIPFAAASDGRADLLRVAAMHVAGDMVLVHLYPTGSGYGSGMSRIGILHPAALIQTGELTEWTELSAYPHGAPDGMQVVMRRVAGGGGACQ